MVCLKHLTCLGLLSFALIAGGASASAAEAKAEVFNEIRFGGSLSIQNAHTHEKGFFAETTIFFDPFDGDYATGWKERLKKPRVNIGISVNDKNKDSQLFAGFDWTTPMTDKFYLEAGFGGVLHNGSLVASPSGPGLGCHLLFHEYLGAGYRFDPHWDATLLVSHSSHAGICGRNDGMTRAGLQIGYKY